MRNLTTVLILGCLLPAGLMAANVDPQAMLAEWDGGGVSVEQYTNWWERMTPRERPVLDSEEAKLAFLDNVINAQIMLDEAHQLKIDQHPNIVQWVAIRRANMLKEYVFTHATEGRVKIEEAEVEALYDKRAEQITARHIVVPTFARAKELRDSLEAGESFADLATRYSTCVSGANQGYLGPVRWGDFSERWSAQAFALEPGQISQPFEVDGGYCIVKVESKRIADLADPAGEKEAIRSRLLKDAIFAERQSYLDSLVNAYNVQTDISAVIDLCLRYGDTLNDLNLSAEVVDINVEPPLTDTEKAIPVVTFDGGEFDFEDVVNMINGQPYVVRPHLDNPEQMVNFINRQLNDSLVIREAYKLGYDKVPEIQDELEKITQKRTLMRFYNYISSDLTVPEDTVRAFFEARKDEFRIQPGHTASKIVTRTRAEAESLLTRIQQGAPFEDLARQYSIDKFTAPEGGDMGFVAKGRDEEFDGFFAQMNVGDMKIFRSVEGHVILWLKSRQEEKAPTFEEAQAAAEESLRPVYKARVLRDWVNKRREDVHLRIHEDLLSQVDLGS